MKIAPLLRMWVSEVVVKIHSNLFLFTPTFHPRMFAFITQNQENNRLELLVDGNLFSETVCMKAAYTFLDRAYFFFRKKENDTIVQIHPKEWQRWSGEVFAMEYSDELLATLLRLKLETENKEIRESIIKRALFSYVDSANFRNLDALPTEDTRQIDFDADIDKLLSEIENDPDLKIDQEQIDKILAEIEIDVSHSTKQNTPKIDPLKIKHAKEKFQSR